MSMLPDPRTESFLTIPADTQSDLREAMARLQKAKPDAFLPASYQTSMWESRFVLTPEAGSFVAAAILAKLAAI